MKYLLFLIELNAMGVAGTAPKVQGVRAWSQRTAGRPRGRHTTCADKMPVGDPEPTPQCQNFPISMRQSPEAK